MDLSAVILAKNEEENILQSIESVNFCDEIIVIDDYSKDKTTEIARNHGANVFRRRLNNDFASQRNFGLQKAKGEWVLFLDADERVSENLKKEILHLIGTPKSGYSGFFLKRKDVIFGKEVNHGEMGSLKLLRLAKKGSGFWKRSVHESWNVKGKTLTLANSIYHYPHQNLREFIDSVNYFSSLHALSNRREGKNSSLVKIILWPLGHFIKNWIFKKGFLDGTLGFVMAMFMSFHSFLAWSKLWLLQKKRFTKL